MKHSSICIASLLALAPFAVSASTLQAYEIDKTQTTFARQGGAPYGAFQEVYLFKLDSADFPNATADVAFSLAELKLGNALNIDFDPKFAEGLVGANDVIDSVVFSRDQQAQDVIWHGDPVAASYGLADVLSVDTFHVSGLTNAPYFYLTITGEAFGTGINSGSFSFEITAVPEPETYALALTGLALVGWVANKRRKAG
jgi:hypothetical protein